MTSDPMIFARLSAEWLGLKEWAFLHDAPAYAALRDTQLVGYEDGSLIVHAPNSEARKAAEGEAICRAAGQFFRLPGSSFRRVRFVTLAEKLLSLDAARRVWPKLLERVAALATQQSVDLRNALDGSLPVKAEGDRLLVEMPDERQVHDLRRIPPSGIAVRECLATLLNEESADESWDADDLRIEFFCRQHASPDT